MTKTGQPLKPKGRRRFLEPPECEATPSIHSIIPVATVIRWSLGHFPLLLAMVCCAVDEDASAEEREWSRRCACRGVVALIVFGVISLALLIAVPLGLSPLVASQIASAVTVDSNASASYTLWQSNIGPNAAPPERFSIYVFNVTNARQVLEQGEKPKLDQLGPFVYKSAWHRFDVEFASDGKSVQYYTFNSFVLDPAASVGDPKATVVTTLNLPVLGVRAQLDDAQWPGAFLADVLLDAFNASESSANVTAVSPLFFEQSVDALVWGFESPLLRWLNATLAPQPTARVELQHNSTSEQGDRAFFQQRDEYGTGLGDLAQLGVVRRWTKYTTMAWWGNESNAQTLTGTDGHGFEPGLTEKSQIVAWANEVFRPIKFDYVEKSAVHGLSALRFMLNTEQFSRTCSDLNPTCGPYWLHSPDGMTNLTSPLLYTTGQALPMFLSQPRFSLSDPWYKAQVEFLPPNDFEDPMRLQTFIDGVVVNASKRLQVVAQLDPTPLLYPQLRPVFLPLFWFELAAAVTPDLADMLASQLALPRHIQLATLIAAPTLAAVLFIAAALLWRARVRVKMGLRSGGYSVQGRPESAEYTSLLATTEQ